MTTISIKDASGVTQAVEAPLPPGRGAAAASRPVALSTEDLAAINAIATALAGIATAANQGTANTTLAAILSALQSALPLPTGAATAANQGTTNTTLTAISGKLPAALGYQAATASLSTTPGRGTLTDRSGTITAGGTAQVLMAANTSRLGFSVQNLSTTSDLWVNPLGTATAAQPSLKLPPGAYFETPAGYGSTGAVSIIGATTAQAFSAREW